METNCTTCENSTFCESWGEWKCLKKHCRIYGPNRAGCGFYKPRTKEMSKCQCGTCSALETEDE